MLPTSCSSIWKGKITSLYPTPSVHAGTTSDDDSNHRWVLFLVSHLLNRIQTLWLMASEKCWIRFTPARGVWWNCLQETKAVG
jgi:hypothetical protein